MLGLRLLVPSGNIPTVFFSLLHYNAASFRAFTDWSLSVRLIGMFPHSMQQVPKIGILKSSSFPMNATGSP